MSEFLIFLLGTCFGALSYLGLVLFGLKGEKKKIFKENNKFFQDVYDSLIVSGKFVNRVNDNVDVSIIMGGVTHTLIYLMDKSEIALFQGKDCIKISSNIEMDRDIITKIISEINSKWYKKINSVVNINGSLIDSSTYDRIMSNFNFEDTAPPRVENHNFNLDDILDKIGQLGYENLSNSEKEFLKKFK